jgi:hypothetical protein
VSCGSTQADFFILTMAAKPSNLNPALARPSIDFEISALPQTGLPRHGFAQHPPASNFAGPQNRPPQAGGLTDI